MRKLCLIAISFLVLLASCETIGDGKTTGLQVASYINQGQADQLTKLSSVPFIIDRDIVNIPADIGVFWKAFTATGFKVEQSQVSQLLARDAAGIKAFGDTMEIRSFFSKYVDPKAVLVQLDAKDGRKLLLIVKDQGSKSVLYGFKGPY